MLRWVPGVTFSPNNVRFPYDHWIEKYAHSGLRIQIGKRAKTIPDLVRKTTTRGGGSAPDSLRLAILDGITRKDTSKRNKDMHCVFAMQAIVGERLLG